MMTQTPQPVPDQDDETKGFAQPVLKWIGVFILGSFALGFTTAGVENLFEDPDKPLLWLLLALGILALLLALYFARRILKASAQQRLSTSERGSNRLLLLSALLGGVLSIAMMAGTGLTGERFDLFSNDPVPALVAAIVSLAWLVLMPWITIAWLKTVDEHERDTYNFGALLGLHVYVLIVPAWWLGWRGGFLPEPNHMLIYLGVIVIWSLAWLWRRLR